MTLAGALAVSVITFAPQAAYSATRTFPLAVVAREYQFVGLPSYLPEAQYNLTMYNLGREPHVLVAVNLGPVCSQSITTKAQALAFLETTEAEALGVACPGSSFAGEIFAPPGGRRSAPLTLTPGRTLYFCPIPESHGVPHLELGMIGFITVRDIPDGYGF